MDEMITGEAVDVGENCGTCDHFLVREDGTLYPMVVSVVECSIYEVEWNTNGTAHKGTRHAVGASFCLMWQEHTRQQHNPTANSRRMNDV